MSSNAQAAQPGTPQLIAVEPVVTAVVRGVVPMAGIRDFFDASFRALGETLARQQVAVLGPAFGLYHRPPGETADLEVGFPTDRAVRTEGPEASEGPEGPEGTRGKVAVGALPAARVARAMHHGSFDGLAASWESLFAWVRAQGLTPGPVMWEVYVTEPTPEMSPDDLRTELNCVVTG
ncbi:GyrI-like domain-containing protein [Streptomyces marispadix]|uniref:GyrI-like domain-containing protein n=1 Tax=Streptomyces marispadix TaxID=2922868 RepID=A0ABS9SW07_9ACTN|nr:GyrI-like domain-containing protein [Streptomyces marispadix]MCH6160388.1 GyrI-like domain-containing protein [Streptomyces marispadix]